MQEKQSKSPNFISDLQIAFSSLNEQEAKAVKLLFGESNDRQKLKSIKKVLQTQGDSQLKTIFNRVIQQPILNEYLFGRLESKPVVLNIFKVLAVSDQLLIAQTDKLTSFEHIKLLIEVIQMLTISNKLAKQSKELLKTSKLFVKIYSFLIAEFSKGTDSISKNQFRSKWLQYFIEVLRCINYVLKFLGEERSQYKQNENTVYKLTEQCARYAHLLNKQVITQLYIILITVNRDLSLPESSLQQIHYFHACTIVKGQNTLKPLLKLASQLKDTEQKSQLAPILLKSFLDYFEQGKKQNIKLQLDQQLKLNAFDCAISLFEVGRSIYSYLEEIIDIIITNGGNWSLEGNFTRKFFITTVALKHVSTQTIFNLWPTCLESCFVESGNMTMAYVTDCAEALLTKLYLELDKDYSKWMKIWIQLYKKLLASENRAYIRGVTDFINPILLKINSSNSLLLKQVSSLPQQNLSTQLGIISLIKCYKQIGKIESKYNIYLEQKKIIEQQTKKKEKQAKKEKKQTEKTQTVPKIEKTQKREVNQQSGLNLKQIVFVHLDDDSFQFGFQFLLSLLLSNDSTTSLQTLEFLATSRKPSNLILPQQMKLILEFYKNCLKTSMPEYRKNYLNLTRRILQRFRKNYEKDLAREKQQQTKSKKQKISTQFFEQFVQFINSLIEECFVNIYPDSIFQITNPALQILLLILNLFGPKGCQIRKGTFIQSCSLLVERTSFFRIQNFQNLVICLQSSYESIRCIAYEILKSFTNFDEVAIKSLRKLWDESVFNTNKLSIRSYEFACRMLVFIGSLKSNEKNIVQIPEKYSLNQLNIAQFLLSTLRKRYQIFKEQFVDQGQVYYKNLIHGVLTCFSYILDQISKITSFTDKNLEDINIFLAQFFSEIVKILNFSVDISSANVSTVVLDTLANASQTDKKLTVDCRGHFLTDKKSQTGNTIGSYLDSTALITSMENEQQGIENTLVVSFYLLTREAGLVFQSIGSLMANSILGRNIPRKPLIQLVNTYFYALINLKHMGSVDRISNGLSKMAGVILDQEDPDLMKIPEQLLDQLLNLLGDGKFTNILRRSAGIPYAFSCLLKSQAIKRKLLIEKTIKLLLNQSREQTNSSIQLRIHSLNILKKLFQDSDLKQDLDLYVSEAFMCAIRGFTSQQWGVRNSSLMLFSVLANRTVGIRPTYNLLEFFHRCPDLFQFISKELQQLNSSTMYPPLYPIVLLLSRLLPFDLREKARAMKNNTTKQMRKEELLALEPLLRRAGNNHNYMGRVMTAKAILPFMYLSNIVPHCLELLEQHVGNIRQKTINNNNQHYRLTECYQLLRSYHQILTSTENNIHYPTISKQAKDEAYQILCENSCFLNRQCVQDRVSPTVHEIYFRIFNDLIQNYFHSCETEQQIAKLNQLSSKVFENSSQTLSKLIRLKANQVGDLGYSLMYKSCIELIHTCSLNLLRLSNFQHAGLIFMQYLNCDRSIKLDQETDYQIFCLVLEKVVALLEAGKQAKHCRKLQEQLSKWLSLIKISEIMSDEAIIKILSIYTSGSIRISQKKMLELVGLLEKMENKSENKHMKVAIFQFLLAHVGLAGQTEQSLVIKKQSTAFLQSLLSSYSNPNQLDDLRQCCVLYLQKTDQLKASLAIVYLRLLDDQQYQIRKRAAGQISRILKIRPCNEFVVVRQILWRFIRGESYIEKLNPNNSKINQQQQKLNLKMNPEQQVKFIKSLLEDNSDYEIRIKNHAEERIFSYDKPNKYRTDINILFETVSLMDVSVVAKLRKAQNSQANFKVQDLISHYENQIMQRNQYQFQTILRAMLANSDNQQNMEVFKPVISLQPILQQMYTKLTTK